MNYTPAWRHFLVINEWNNLNNQRNESIAWGT